VIKLFNKKAVYKIFKGLYWAITVLILFIALFLTLSYIGVPGGIKFYNVMSGSMEPAISAGSVVTVKPVNSYEVGDIITYKSELYRELQNPPVTTTHRIYRLHETIDGIRYETKGDANDGADNNRLSEDLIVGKVILKVPLLGNLLEYVKTQTGFIILIVIPATLIIYSELQTVRDELRKLLIRRKERQNEKIH
jgi:signal peptidase I